MEKLDTSLYQSIIPQIRKTPCGTVYPLSLAEMNQYGDIYKDRDSILLWHYSGFAFIYGACDDLFLETIYNMFLSSGSSLPRRFILFTADPEVVGFFQKKPDITFGKRYNFEYPAAGPAFTGRTRPDHQICRFDTELFDSIPGRITPRFSWRDASEFLAHGIGYCVMYEGKAVSWAFSAAVSSDELDIGIETVSEYRHMGFGAAAAEKMIQYCLDNNKRPVWSCDVNNTISQKTAERLGFVISSEYSTIRR